MPLFLPRVEFLARACICSKNIPVRRIVPQPRHDGRDAWHAITSANLYQWIPFGQQFANKIGLLRCGFVRVTQTRHKFLEVEIYGWCNSKARFNPNCPNTWACPVERRNL